MNEIARRLLIAALAASLPVAAATTALRPVEDIRPVVYYSTACPPPADREAADRAAIVARLRELDRMLAETIADLDTPEEPRP